MAPSFSTEASNSANGWTNKWSTGGGWQCSQCGQTVFGSHICPQPSFPTWPPVDPNAAVMQEILELLRELHSVIFRDRIRREIGESDESD